MSAFLNVFYFVLVMGILVFVHELGHLLAAKSFGVYCKEFAIGMGPKLFSWMKKGGETTYSVRAFPIGGFVAMAGEPGEEDMGVAEERSISGIKPWKRLIIMMAGIVMNFILAFLIFTGLFWSQGVVESPDGTIYAVSENSPAAQAGLQADDLIVSLAFEDGKVYDIENFSDISMYINIYGNRELTVNFLREGVLQSVALTPVKNGDYYIIGVQAGRGTVHELNFFEAMATSAAYIVTTIQTLFLVISKIFTGYGMEAIGGPIQIFAETSKIQSYGMSYFFILLGSLSVSLAVMNSLPVPIFDGGRALLIIIEVIIRRPLPKKLENAVMLLGLMMVVLLFVFIMYNDINKLL